MILILSSQLVLYLALTLLALSIPGLLLLKRIGFSSKAHGEVLVAMVSSSLAYWALLGILLGYLGLYYRAALLAALIIPMVALFIRPSHLPIWPSGFPRHFGQSLRQIGFADGVALSITLLYLVLAGLDALTSPFTVWDAIVSWDKWAVDWARRTVVRDYLFGGYGQLLPIFSSMNYKIAGTFDAILPPQMFVNHAFHALIGALLVLALYRISRIFGTPLWIALVTLFGLAPFRESIISGNADLLLTFLATASLLLLVSYLDKNWKADASVAWVFVPVCSALLLTKPSGALYPVLLFALAVHFGLSNHTEFRELFPHPLKTGLTIAALTCACALTYYGQQIYLNHVFDVHKADPFAHQFTLEVVRDSLKIETARANEGLSFLGSLAATGRKVFAAYGSPAGVTYYLAALFSILFACSLGNARFALLGGFFLIYAVLATRITAYDLRNLLPALPIFCLLISSGAVIFDRRFLGGTRWMRRAFHAPLYLALLLCTVPVLQEIRTEFNWLESGRLSERLKIMASSPSVRLRGYFKHFERDIDFLESTALYWRADHVFVTRDLYRFLHNGIYPIKMFDWDMIRSGDIYANLESIYKPTSNPWTYLKAGALDIWVYDPATLSVDQQPIDLTGSNPPKLLRKTPQGLDVRFSGPNSIVAMRVPNLQSLSGGSIVWRVGLSRLNDLGPERPLYMTYFHRTLYSKVNKTGTVVVEKPVLGIDKNLLMYSGILTLQDLDLPLEPSDAVIVGIACDTAGQEVSIKQFVMSQYSRSF